MTDKIKLVKCYYLRVFAPPTRAPHQGADEEEAGIFYMRSTQEEQNVDNAAHDDGGGISMVHWCGLKNLLMVKASLTTG